MNQDEHQRERMRAWSHFAVVTPEFADERLAQFDKRFPAPSTAAPVEPVPVPDQSAMGMAVSSLILDQTAELASLRQKARLWDAVTLNVPLRKDAPREWVVGSYSRGNPTLPTIFPTAEEAVESAIAQGALK